MKQLTDTQQRTLDFIQAYIRENGAPPTNAELASGMGWASANNAQLHLKALQRKGCLQIRKGISRGIVLCDAVTLDIPDTASQEYWMEGIFQHLRYERDVHKVIQSAGLKGSKKSWGEEEAND